MNEDWEQVTPFLQDMQHCAEEDYFNPQEVSETLKAPERSEKKTFITLPRLWPTGTAVSRFRA